MTTAVLPIAKRKNVRPKSMSVEQFERHPELKGYELAEGQLERKAMGAKSSWLNIFLGHLLTGHVIAHRLGFTFDSECMYRCLPSKPRTIRRPDISFVKKDRLPNGIPNGIIELAPDFVIEVMSIHDRWSRVNRKVQEYLSAGVQLIWVVDPETSTVHAYLPNGSSTRFNMGDELSADPIVPGFRILVSELFTSTVSN